MWYYAIGDNEEGPIPAAELKSLAMEGTISRTTLVWKEGMDDWKPASDIPGLLPVHEPVARRSSAGRSTRQSAAAREPREDYGYYGSTDNPYEADYRTGGVRPPDGASLVLTLGLVAIISMPFLLLVCPILPIFVALPCGIGTWIVGNSYMARCREFGSEPEGTATAGRICGIIAVAICGLLLLLAVGGIALFALAA